MKKGAYLILEIETVNLAIVEKFLDNSALKFEKKISRFAKKR